MLVPVMVEILVANRVEPRMGMPQGGKLNAQELPRVKRLGNRWTVFSFCGAFEPKKSLPFSTSSDKNF